MYLITRRYITIIPKFVKDGFSTITGGVTNGATTVANGVVNGVTTGVTTVSTVTGNVVDGVTNVAGTVVGGVAYGVNTVTGVIGDTKDQLIAVGILQNVNTLNAVKRALHKRNEPDPITISLVVNLGVANVNLSTVYTPNQNKIGRVDINEEK